MILWRWSSKHDDWQYETEGPEYDVKAKRRVLFHTKRRHPTGTKFRWSFVKPRKLRRRTAKP